ncbi:MAG: prepilin-type N-terminal cleavage/methylation domain-containing protein, partial [Candidatus Hydrogenedentes bacterium]|nr:prepilin-type N-terminal cleavage/methylation domain-containing protein [Candidatus Hydrogenedentota bacterium]
RHPSSFPSSSSLRSPVSSLRSHSSFIRHPSSFPSSSSLRSPVSSLSLGFTLIEILVTLAIFTAVLAVLVEGLHSGIRAWKSVRLHQVRQAQLNLVVDKLTEDFRHLIALPDTTPIAETTLDTGGEKVKIATSVPRKRQRAGIGWVWNEIEISTALDDTGAKILRRTIQPHVGTSLVGSEPTQETLLTNVKSAQFDYLGPDGQTPVWESKDSLPTAVLIRITPETGPEIVIPAWVPAGSLKRTNTGA